MWNDHSSTDASSRSQVELLSPLSTLQTIIKILLPQSAKGNPAFTNDDCGCCKMKIMAPGLLARTPVVAVPTARKSAS
jgi:hypothetical protein